MKHLSKIQNAIKFATKTHEVYQKQKRKGKDIPYITHPLTVGLILAHAGASEDIVIAGLLHDTIEDSHKDHKVTRAMLDERFGLVVGALVASVTEPNKDLPWKERKQKALEHIKTMDVPSLLVKSADVISNVSEILADYKSDGEAVFGRFNAPKADLIANYRSVIKALINGLSQSNNPLLSDLRAIDDDLEKLA
ncbi:MAG: HD domain-containing protein [bacterium]|nr:HD domain-containing protein [bacterium]